MNQITTCIYRNRHSCLGCWSKLRAGSADRSWTQVFCTRRRIYKAIVYAFGMERHLSLEFRVVQRTAEADGIDILSHACTHQRDALYGYNEYWCICAARVHIYRKTLDEIWRSLQGHAAEHTPRRLVLLLLLQITTRSSVSSLWILCVFVCLLRKVLLRKARECRRTQKISDPKTPYGRNEFGCI